MASTGVDISSLGYNITPERYYVYGDGSTLDAFLNKEMLKTVRHGYLCVVLYNITTKKTRQEYLHRIIGKAFIPNLNSSPCINHKDGNKMNNSLENLEWCTYSENTWHRYNRLPKEKQGRHRPKNIGGKPIRCVETGESFLSISDCQRKTGVSHTALCEHLKGRNKTCAKMHWEYIK